MVNEVLTKMTPLETWIDDFVHSKNAKFAGKSTAERISMAKGAYYAKQRRESVEEAAAVSQNSTAITDMNEDHLVHVNDGSKYDEQPHEKDVEHVKSHIALFGGKFDSHSDKGAFFKFPDKDKAERFVNHANKCPHKTCSAEHVTEAVEYKGIGTDVVDKKKKLNPQPNFTTDKKQVKDFKEEVKKSTGDLKKACWKGYTAVGLKMKDGRKVPNCVPEEVQVQVEAKVYDPFTKKMVPTKPIKVQAGGGATKNGVPVETGPSKYKSKLPMSKAAGVLAAEEVELIAKHEVKANAPHKSGGHVILTKSSNKWHVLHNKKSSPEAKDLHRSKLLHSYADEKEARAKFKELHEEQIDELSKGLVARYANKVAKTTQANYDKSKDKFQFSSNRQDGMKNAVKRLTKEETQIDEISRDLADRYVSKVTQQQVQKQGMQPNMYDKLPKNRQQGVSNALKRTLVKSPVKEETIEEQLYKQGRFVTGAGKKPFKGPTLASPRVEESRGHKVLATFMKNREVAQRAFTGQNKPVEKPKEEKKPVKESRKAEIVKNIMRKKKSDTFEAEPELSNTQSKSDQTL